MSRSNNSSTIEQTKGDLKLRKTLFWYVVAFVIGVFLISHCSASRYIYDLNGKASISSKTALTRPLRFGSYGFYLARYPTRQLDRTTVILLGNSVYQDCHIVDRMQRLAENEKTGIDFLNLAQTGSGIYDHLIQFTKVLGYKPNLVVVSVLNRAFSTGVGNNILPKFRTDNDQISFEPDILSKLPMSFYWREFSANDAFDSILSTVFPAKRLDWLIRRDIDHFVARRVTKFPAWFRAKFSLPKLNLVADWREKSRISPVLSDEEESAYPETEQLLKEMLDMAKRHGLPVLFIRQESGPRFDTPDVISLIENTVSSYDNAFVTDLKSFYLAKDMPDHVHPEGDHARNKYALRHYKVVISTLKNLSLLTLSPKAVNPAVWDGKPQPPKR
ncbi:MAG: hypothetical protein SWQ30_13955 [Thermodesulfobacteriota bacterium]|nr:hypothetical protein [Thermodesulfobacteriota bacterium]